MHRPPEPPAPRRRALDALVAVADFATIAFGPAMFALALALADAPTLAPTAAHTPATSTHAVLAVGAVGALAGGYAVGTAAVGREEQR